MIYLDNAATTKVLPDVVTEMNRYMCEEFFNPSALYGASLSVKNAMESARTVIANKLCCAKNEVFFTSCATESNNWALNCGRKYKKGNVVITMGEHPSVFETANALLSKGVDVRFAGLSCDGLVNEEDLFNKIDKETALVSIIHCSNETGAINDLQRLIKKIRALAPNALIHSDGVQAFCKIDTNLASLDLDFYSVSAHKVCGPKGIGALYINKKHKISPLIFGGGQENGLRSGTENTSGIIGFSKAIELYAKNAKGFESFQVRNFVSNELSKLPGIIINGSPVNQSGYILSASIAGIKGEVLQHMLSDHGIFIGLGSACSQKSKHNRVLKSIGRTGKEIEGSIRISFCSDINLEEIKFATKILMEKIIELRGKING